MSRRRFIRTSLAADMMWFGSWKTAEDGAGQVKYTQTRWAGVEPHMRGPHTTDLFEESRQAVNHNYFEKYPRLLKIGQHYDPTNLFRLKTNSRAPA